METIAVIVVMGIVVGALFLGTAKLVHDMVGYQTDMVRESLRAVGETTDTVAANVAREVSEAVSKAAGVALAATLRETVGEKDVPVTQPDNDAEGDIFNPAWLEGIDDDEDDGDVGIGDSVGWLGDTFGREASTAMIGENDSIIPGVPRPDLGGETYEG